MNEKVDTIVAQATPSGKGGVGVVRVSGPNVTTIASQILGKCPEPRLATYCDFISQQNDVIDQGIALYFKAPHSFTGEDVLELQGHGGQIVIQTLIEEIVHLGARIARPGEFSERAFLNDKIDLAQAEAIADLIDASSKMAAQSAIRSLQGQFSNTINQLVTQLIELRMFIEAAIDFPEEEIDFLSDQRLLQRFKDIIASIQLVKKNARQGAILRDGMKVVIAGKPNAGKSSLLNQLSGYDKAIVTEVPGTTRDVLQESIEIDGMPLHVIDTAGLRESDDVVEKIGVQKAKDEIEKADRILYLIDISQQDAEPHSYLNKDNVTVIYNKVDLVDEIPIEEKGQAFYLSAKTGDGIDALKAHLKECMGFADNQQNTTLARARHIAAIDAAENAIKQAHQQLIVNKAGELVAEELRYAQEALSEITGEFRSDDLLGKIFSQFCIGK